MTFLNCRKCRSHADNRRAVFQSDKIQCKRQNEQQHPCDLVHDRMNCHKLLPHNIPGNYIYYFDNCDHSDPDINPGVDIQYRKQLYQTDCNKNEVRSRVQPRSQLTCSIRLSRYCSVNHICNSRSYV